MCYKIEVYPSLWAVCAVLELQWGTKQERRVQPCDKYVVVRVKIHKAIGRNSDVEMWSPNNAVNKNEERRETIWRQMSNDK